jgi:chromate transporter
VEAAVRDDSPINSFILLSLLLSFAAVGGVNAVIPELHRQVVEVNGWLNDRQFADMFAIANASPGPNMLIVTLIGHSLGGFSGAILATLALCTPTCLLTYAVGHLWERFKDAPWRIAVQAGLIPVTVGLIAASAYLLARAADHSVAAYALTLSTAAISYFTRLNPLWLMGVAAALGYGGFI